MQQAQAQARARNRDEDLEATTKGTGRTTRQICEETVLLKLQLKTAAGMLYEIFIYLYVVDDLINYE